MIRPDELFSAIPSATYRFGPAPNRGSPLTLES